MTSAVAKRQFAAAQSALRTILSLYVGTAPREIQFRFGHHGKPFLGNTHRSTLQFNLTHSHDWGLVGVTDAREIGVDMEKVRDRPAAERLAQRFYAEHERAAMAAALPEERTRVFFRLWTRKEGYLKATGTGLSVSLRAIDSLSPEPGSWWYRELAPAPDYVACLVGSGDPPDLTFFDLHNF